MAARIIALAFWAVVVSATLQPAAAQGAFESGSIVFPLVEAKASPSSRQPGLHWVISGLGQATVRVTDPALKLQIENWLLRHQSDKHDWVLNINTPVTLPDRMFGELTDFDLRRAGKEFLRAPTGPDARRDVEFRIQFRARPSPPLSALTIRVTTEGSEIGGVKIDLGDVAPGIASTAEVTAAEIATADVRATTTAALREVAAQAWAISRQHGVVLGAEAPQRRFEPVEKEITRIYMPEGADIAAAGRPEPRPVFAEDEPRGKGRWVLFVRRVRIVRHVTVQVPLVRFDDRHGSAERIAQRQADADRLKQRTEAAAAEHLEADFDKLRNHVPTNAALHAVLDAAEADSALRPPATLVFRGDTVVIAARDAAARFGYELSAEGGWSAEELLRGKGSFSGDNLLRLSNGRARAETETAAFAASQEVQRFTASMSVVTTRSGAQGSSWKTGPAVAGYRSRDANQLFGNPPGTQFSFTSRGITPVYTLEHVSRRFAWKGNVGGTFVSGRVAVEEGILPLSRAISRAYAGLTTSHDVSITSTVRPPDRRGLGVVRTAAHVEGLQVPGGEAFSRVRAAVDASATFGASRSNDFVLRYRTGVEIASEGTPLFELPRLGGFATLRGLEEGEQIARRIGYAQLGFGPSLTHAITWFGRPRPADRRLGPFRLADLYVVAFLDRGVALDAARAADLLWPRSAVGYGAAAEVHNVAIGNMRARLTIGYGRSPDSTRHRRGVAVVSVAVDLN